MSHRRYQRKERVTSPSGRCKGKACYPTYDAAKKALDGTLKRDKDGGHWEDAPLSVYRCRECQPACYHLGHNWKLTKKRKER